MAKEDIAQAMRQRRDELGDTVVAAASKSGLSRTTWRELEAGNRDGLSAPTARRLDNYFDWKPGTAAELFRRIGSEMRARINEIVEQQVELARQVPTSGAETLAPAQWLAALRRLSPEAQDRVWNHLLDELEHGRAPVPG